MSSLPPTRSPAGLLMVRPLARALIVAGGFFVLAEFGLRHAAEPDLIAAAWPAAGWAAALTALWFRDRWLILPAVFLVTLGANLLNQNGVAASLTFGVFNTLEPWLFAALLQGRVDVSAIPVSMSALARFGGIAAIASSLCALGGATALVLLGHSQTFSSAAATWALSDGVAIVAIAPFLLYLPKALEQPLAPPRILEFVAFGAALVALSAVATSQDRADHWLSLAAVALLFGTGLILVARFPSGLGLVGPTVMLLSVMVFGAQPPDGPSYGPDPQATRVAVLQLLVLIMSVGAFGLNVLVSRLLEVQRLRLENDQRHRVATETMLRDADRRKDEFIAILAHELRNPLAPIRQSAELLRLKDISPGKAILASEVIARQVTIMACLLDDLLDVSRITRGRLELREAPVELAALVRHAVETASPAIAAGGHDLRVTLPDEPVWFEADPVRLSQVLANLLNNAAKFSPRPGRIDLSAAVEHEPGGETVVIRVLDSGMGIPPPMLSHVFDMFAQLPPGRNASNSGLGIGLALVRGIVELHGGSVAVRSDGPDTGSEFTVRVPLRPATPAGAQEPRAAHHAQAAPMRVLIADDNRDAADGLGLLLSTQGYTVCVAYDGAQAIEQARTFQPEVMLLDLGMPRLDGYQVAHHVRDQTWGRHTLLVAVTGWGQAADRIRTKNFGFDHHLTKPVDGDTLRRLLEQFERA
jgi:signal transduction histidine kinase/CheY-like chemotaxis protein